MLCLDLERASVLEAPGQNRQKKEESIMTSIKTIVQMFSAWRRHRDVARELSSMNDHELSDIGISRCDIGAIARGERRRPVG